ncbi:MAG: helix-turn-helix transcriptional regulator [Symploca sp. SIO2G7]|nr:helix-turn-helix transcriptional regulator [Symploca sp. SIO2G7]
MAARLGIGHSKDWLSPGSPNDSRLFHADPSDQILLYPPPIGQGYRQHIQLRDDLTLVVVNYTINREVIINGSSSQEVMTKFEFPVSDIDEQHSSFIPGESSVLRAIPKGGQCFEIEVVFKGYHAMLAYVQACLERFPLQLQQRFEEIIQTLWCLKGGRSGVSRAVILSHLSTYTARANLRADYNDPLEYALPEHLYMAVVDFQYASRRVITPRMKLIMGQILSCPYQGKTRRQYLEKKALDLVALRVQAITQPRLHPTELDCIYQAAAILRDEMANPPTVEALARRVSTNRLKLNQGFHEVYGTSPFKYLRDCRLWLAQRLLTTSTLPVESVAAAVGYRSRNHFAKAFRKQTGLNPKSFQIQVWQYAS